MSIAFKFASLGIRTLAKPIGNYIKQQAREHEGFRKLCISFAQQVHRIDMRMRLGLLQDPAVIERQIKREQEEVERKKNPELSPTVKTKEESEAEAKEREDIRKKLKRGRPIKPLSEAKAIDSGATFISEGFLFLVAGGLILFEQLRGKRKDNARRDEVKERLDSLEEEIVRLKGGSDDALEQPSSASQQSATDSSSSVKQDSTAEKQAASKAGAVTTAAAPAPTKKDEASR